MFKLQILIAPAFQETARLSADKAFRKALQNAGLDSSLIEDISHYEEDSLMQ